MYLIIYILVFIERNVSQNMIYNTGLYYCSQHNEDRSDHVSLAWDVTARDPMDERSGYDITMRHPAGSNI